MGRIADPVEVVGLIIALAAVARRDITGQTIHIDGGDAASQ